MTAGHRGSHFRSRSAALLLVTLWVLASSSPASSRVLGLDVTSRTDVAAGERFGDAGPYERITGRVSFAVDISNPHDRRIVDLALAENLKDGQVAFSADVVIVRPKDPARGNGSMLLEVPNRGQPRIVSLVDGGKPDLSDVGDAWLLRHGYTLATIGWQWDAVGDGALRLQAPIARERGGSITGLLRSDLTPSHRLDEVPLGHYFPLLPSSLGGSEYAAADTADARNVLTVRDRPDDPPGTIPRARWTFAHLVDGAPVPSDRSVRLDGGFTPGRIYELVYVVRDPVIAGLGLAAIRDFASWSKHDPTAIAPVARVYGEGISQDGRLLRDFLYRGYNADEEGRIALDGVLAHVAGAGRGSFDQRFAQPSRDGQPMSSLRYPVDVFPFTDQPERDPLTGERAGLLERCVAEGVVPRVFFSHTSYEYWGRAAALIHVTPDGRRDAPISDPVRIYFYSGLQHFSGPFPPVAGTGDISSRQPQSPLPIRWFWRAMIANMDAWVRSGVAPPPSRYPRLDRRELVPLAMFRFPAIPGVQAPKRAVRAWRLDFGPEWRKGVLTLQPPVASQPFPALVPKPDADGNDLGGVRLPEQSVPLATYTGWNLRDPSIGAPDQCVSFLGSYLPFPRTAEERRARRDPRRSIAERYANRADYLTRYQAALDALARERYILSEDEPAMLERGGEEWDLATR